MTTIQKWGKRLAVCIPARLAEQIDVTAGTAVDITAQNGALLVTPRKRPKYRLRDLLKKCQPARLQGEIDFGPAVGREVLD